MKEVYSKYAPIAKFVFVALRMFFVSINAINFFKIYHETIRWSAKTCATIGYGKFDQRRADANQYTPIPFRAGQKEGLIPGFIEGLEKMSFGDKAVLFIPPHLAYGEAGAGGIIPPNATIIFEIELSE